MKSDDPNKAITKQEGDKTSGQNPNTTIDEDSEALIGMLPEEVVKNLPPETREKLGSQLSIVSMMGRMPSSLSLTRQVTSEHIGKLIDNNEKNSEREYQRFINGEVTKRFIIVAILILVLIVLVYAGLTKDKQLSEKIITAGITTLGGFGAGYAVGKRN